MCSFRGTPFFAPRHERIADGIATSILTPQLARIAVTYGEVFAILPGNIALYQRTLPRFGPTHYVGLNALDLDTGRERDVYPLQPYAPARLQAIAAAQAEYEAMGRTLCAERNHHCDPQRFDNSFGWPGLENSHVFNAATGALAIAVTHLPDTDTRIPVVVRCAGDGTLDGVRCEERALEDWQRSLQTPALQEVLERAAASF